MRRSKFQVTTILADARLVLCTPFNEVIALDPGTGRRALALQSEDRTDYRPANLFNCRGVALLARPGRETRRGLRRAHLHRNERRARHRARCCVRKALRGIRSRRPGARSIPACRCSARAKFQITSPPVAANGVVVVGSAINDNQRAASPRGTVRAFDARSGKLRWEWDPIPTRADDPGSENLGRRLEDHWQRERLGADVGRHGARSRLPADFEPEPGLLRRPASRREPCYANSVVAVKLQSGEVAWHFQTVHHDVWDYDVPRSLRSRR
jgi:quinoprotein glucose dehydrogenase